MGKGDGKGRTPREARDNLKSTQMLSVIDALGEGPIEGSVNGLQSILVNKTPLTNQDGKNRITFIDPANGNKMLMFVAQGDQVFMNDVFMKSLTSPPLPAAVILRHFP